VADRAQADAVFWEAMACSEEPAWAQRLMWQGVRVGGRRAWEAGPGRYLVLAAR